MARGIITGWNVLGQGAKALPALALFLLLFALTASVAAQAQPVEESPAAIMTGDQVDGLALPVLDAEGDDTFLGVNLTTLVVVDAARMAGIVKVSTRGVDVSRAPADLQTLAVTSALAGFLNRPISQALVAEIQAVLTQALRDAGRPLAAVTVPPQEITGGMLQINVRQYVVGEKRAEGNERTSDEQILETIRAEAGEPVESEELIDDLNWLNQNPFRNSVVVFSPGAKPGTTDLTIRTTEERPWAVFAGMTYSGDFSDNDLKVNAGFNTLNPVLPEHQVAYRFAATPSAITNGNPVDLGQTIGYLSHSLAYFAPLDYGDGIRHKARLDVSYIHSLSELTDPITQSSRVASLYAEYAVPVGSGTTRPEVYGGIDVKRQISDIYFGGAPSSQTTLDLVQFIGGVRGAYGTPIAGMQRNSFDVRLVHSPGNLAPFNADADFVAASGDAAASATYTYAYASLNHAVSLTDGLALGTRSAVQWAPEILPGLEQFGVGGNGSVRGYASNEAAGEIGGYVQAELRWTGFEVPGGEKMDLAAQPFAFLDMGAAHSIADDLTVMLASVGAGVELAVGENLTASFVAAVPLVDGVSTTAYAPRLHAEVTAHY